MKPFQHKSNNHVFRAPTGWDHEQNPCSALPVTLTEWAGLPAVVSFWKPTPDELAILNAGGSVALFITGITMPPVGLAVEPA